MTRVEHIPEYRLVVPGKAQSFRSQRAGTYRGQIRAIAKGIFPPPDRSQRVEVRLDYFHCHRRRFDMDNVAKCVLDALNGIAYVDDQQVREQVSQAHDLRHVVHLPEGPVDLIKPLRDYDTYLFVRVRHLKNSLPKG